MSESTTGKTFLVVGATGNCGSLVTSGLLERGERVRAMTRSADRAKALREAGAEVVTGDLDCPETLGPAFDGADTVFVVTTTGPNGAEQGKNAIAAAKKAGVSHFVRYSAINNSLSDPLRSSRQHAEVESALVDSGVPYSFVRPHHYMQNLLVAAPTIQSDSAIYLPYGEARMGIVDIRNVAEVAVEVLTGDGHTGKAYDVTGPASITIAEAAEAISNAIGRKVSYVDIPPETARESLLSMGLGEWLADEYIAYFKAFAGGYGDFTRPDYEQLMGRKPATIAQFARDYASVFGAVPAGT